MANFVRTTNESRSRFRAMYIRKKTSGGRAYLQIVESRREGGSVRQQVIATLGRLDDLQQSGQLELSPATSKRRALAFARLPQRRLFSL